MHGALTSQQVRKCLVVSETTGITECVEIASEGNLLEAGGSYCGEDIGKVDVPEWRAEHSSLINHIGQFERA